MAIREVLRREGERVPGQIPQPYEGDRPYIFINYARADKGAVQPIIRALADEGFRVWWDDGIEPMVDYDEYLADHVHGCECLVMFVSSSSLRSDWCTLEARYALDLGKKVLPIYLEDVELTRGLQMRMGGKQALFWYKYDSDEAFYNKLFKAHRLEPCLTEKGEQSRGVRPRGAGSEVDRAEVSQSSSVQVGPKVAPKVVPETRPTPKDEPKDALKIEPKADTKSTPKAAPTTKAVQGVSIGQRGNTIPPRVKRLEDGAASGRRSTTLEHTAEADKLGRASGVARKDKLTDYSWAELKVLSRAIALAGSDEDWLAIAKAYRLVDKDGKLQGDEKPLELKDGTNTSARVLGFRHDELATGGKSGISFEFADVPALHRMNPTATNRDGWDGCEMREWLNSEFFSLLPDDLRPLVEAARKWTNNKGRVARNDVESVTVTDDRLWLLSAYEVYGGVPSLVYSPATYAKEGTQYRFYADEGVTAADCGFCVKDGADSWWWLRSPSAHDSYGFRHVYSDGDCYASYADHDWGVSPGFCL